MRKPCLSCGELSERSRCDGCEVQNNKLNARGRVKNERNREADRQKYGSPAWRALSARARRLQPWCSDCGTSEDLTTDHLPSAWERVAQGKSIRLRDVQVLCRSHNAKRGSSQPGSERANAA